MFGSPFRLATVLGMEPALSDDRIEMLDHFRKNIKQRVQADRADVVTDGPVLENVVRGDDVDVFSFPVPIHHELDGGRYIGTACGVVTRDPDTGRVNVGTYRVQAMAEPLRVVHLERQARADPPRQIPQGRQAVSGRDHRRRDPITYLAGGYTMADDGARISTGPAA